MKNIIENKKKSLLFTLSCVVMWAFIPVVAKLGQQGLDNYQFLFWSSILSFFILLISTIATNNIQAFSKLHKKGWLAAIGLGFLGAFLYYLLLYYAYGHARGLEVLSLQYTWPIFIVVFSVVFLKEKLSSKTITASLVGFLGVLLVLTKGNFSQIYFGNIGIDLVVLLAAATFGLFSVLSKKTNLEPFSSNTIFFLSASVFSFIAMISQSHFAFPNGESIFPLLVNGGLINGISYIFWMKALRYADASFVAPFVFLTPVLAAIILVVIFGEQFLPVYGVGMAMVLISGLITQRK